MKTLLQIVQTAQAELGLQQSSSVVGSTDRTTQQMFALANRAIDEMRQMNRWTACQFEYNLVASPPFITTGDVSDNSAVITNLADDPIAAGVVPNFWAVNGIYTPQAARVLTVDSTSQVTMTMETTGTSTGGEVIFSKDTYPIPSDFDYFNNQTMWDRTNFWQLLGPDSPQTDQWHRSGIYTTGPRRHFRKIGPYTNTFRIWPQPKEIVEPLQLVFEYLSLNSVLVNGDQADGYAQYFANDDDQPLLSDQAIIMGIKWLFWQVKGFGYLEMQNNWIDYVERLAARDGGAKTLSFVNRPTSVLLTTDNIQDGNWPGSSSNS